MQFFHGVQHLGINSGFRWLGKDHGHRAEIICQFTRDDVDFGVVEISGHHLAFNYMSFMWVIQFSTY